VIAGMDQPLDDPSQGRADLGIPQRAVRSEGVLRARDRQLVVDHPGSGRGEDLAYLGLCPDRAEQAGAGADHRGRLGAEAVVRERPGGPVERVLELTGDGMVVLRRGDQDRVGTNQRRPQLDDRAPERRVVGVLVVGRDRTKPRPLREVDRGRQLARRRAEQPPVVGAATQAPGYAEDQHRLRPA